MTGMQNGEGELQRLTLGGDGDLGYHDTGHGETIVLVHAGVFSDWFRPLSRQLPRERFRVVRTRRSGYGARLRPGGTWAWPITPGTLPACWTGSAPAPPIGSGTPPAA